MQTPLDEDTPPLWIESPILPGCTPPDANPHECRPPWSRPQLPLVADRLPLPPVMRSVMDAGLSQNVNIFHEYHLQNLGQPAQKSYNTGSRSKKNSVGGRQVTSPRSNQFHISNIWGSTEVMSEITPSSTNKLHTNLTGPIEYKIVLCSRVRPSDLESIITKPIELSSHLYLHWLIRHSLLDKIWTNMTQYKLRWLRPLINYYGIYLNCQITIYHDTITHMFSLRMNEKWKVAYT